MLTIKFSHYYPKLHGQTSAELLAVRPLKIDAHTPRELLEYDTTYKGGRYPLRSGAYIQLIFLGNLRIPFCTIRSAYPPSKVRYYYNSVGRTFAIETPALGKCTESASTTWMTNTGAGCATSGRFRANTSSRRRAANEDVPQMQEASAIF